jgi:hypothetical protein
MASLSSHGVLDRVAVTKPNSRSTGAQEPPGFTYSGQSLTRVSSRETPSTFASAARASAAWTGLTRAGRLTGGHGEAAV